MPVYVTKQLEKYKHEVSKRPQYAPYPSAPKKYGASTQETIKIYDSKPAGLEVINHVHKIFSIILYYARSVEPTILMELSTLASEQANAAVQTIKNLHQLLDYLGTHPYATIRYYASDMILDLQSDAS